MGNLSTTTRGALVLISGFVVACAAAGGDSGATPLLGSTWQAVEVSGQELAERPRVTLSFEQPEEGGGLRAAGSGGCNRYFGPVEIEGERIAFGPLAATRRACEVAVMDGERSFFAALDDAARFELQDDGSLVLYGEDATLLVRLVETAP